MEDASDRRTLLGLGGLVLFASALPDGLVACAGEREAAKDQSAARQPATPDDPRWTALATALRAPSSHNSQPWLVHLPEPHSIDFYVDPARKLPEADPLGRQLLISQGTFVETCSIALRHSGHTTRLEYFPGGSGSAVQHGLAAVGRVVVERHRDHGDEALFSAIATRQTNKRVYADRSIPSSDLEAIAAHARVEGCELQFITAPSKLGRIAALCREAMSVDVSDRERNVETAAWFRFDDAELEERRDGFGIGQSGVTGLNKWMAEAFFLSRKSAAEPNGTFAKKSVELAWKQASSASAFGILTTSGNGPEQQLDAGRAYVRAQLGAEVCGIRTQPLSQLVQDYASMTPLRRELEREVGLAPGREVQMLFRLGYAKPTPPSPRRPVQALLRRTDVRAEPSGGDHARAR